MKCTGNIVPKSNGGGSFCNIKVRQTASAVSYGAGAGTLLCADVNLKDKTGVSLRQTLYNGTAKVFTAPQRNFWAQNTQPTTPSSQSYEWIKPGTQRLCATKQPIYMTAPSSLANAYIDKWGLEVINAMGPDIAVYSIYKLDSQNPTPGWN